MKTYYLYHLIDPNDNVVRYVGISYQPKRRYAEHLNGSKKLKTHKDCWIAKLLNDNQKPIMLIILETQDKEEIFKFEIEHIAKYDNLTNLTNGGEYYTYKQEVIDKIKERYRNGNHPSLNRIVGAEERMRLSLAHKNIPHTESWKRNIGLSSKIRKEVTINGITYSSIKEAMRKLKLGYKSIIKLVTS